LEIYPLQLLKKSNNRRTYHLFRFQPNQ